MPLPNPHVESSCPNQHPIMAMQPHVIDMLFSRSTYLKKLIEEANAQEDTKKLLQFCCWENPTFSHAVLYELLWQIAIAYTYELRPYLDLLLAILLMEDSWQTLRIQKSLKGQKYFIFLNCNFIKHNEKLAINDNLFVINSYYFIYRNTRRAQLTRRPI